jgi:hypothetical protein
MTARRAWNKSRSPQDIDHAGDDDRMLAWRRRLDLRITRSRLAGMTTQWVGNSFLKTVPGGRT